MRATRLLGAVLVGVLALLGAACGGDDDVDAAGDGGGGGSDDSEQTTTTEGSSDDGDDSGDGDIPESGVPGFGNLDECLEFVTAYGSLGLVLLGGTAGAEVDFEATLDDLDEARGAFPDDAQDALDVVIDTYTQVGDDLDDAGVDLSDPNSFFDPENAEAYSEATAPLSSPEFNEANNEVTTALTSMCTPG